MTLFAALPNFFVGLGLLGTFIGLIAALTFSSQNLTGATNQEEIKQALNGLLTTAAAKFYISAAGLISSLILSFLIRLGHQTSARSGPSNKQCPRGTNFIFEFSDNF